MRNVTSLIAATVLAACAGRPVPAVQPAELPATISLSRGQQATVGSTTIRFNAVLADSRCTGGVTCVWAGSVDLELVVAAAAGDTPPRSVVLRTNAEPKSAAAMGLRFSVDALTEAPATNDLDGDYRIRLRVESAVSVQTVPHAPPGA